MGCCFSAMRVQDIYTVFIKHPFICTDSRKSVKGAVFFALRGPSFDGNAFAREALDRGCAFAVVDDPTVVQNDRFILVKDSLAALQELAGFHRSHFQIPVLAITGTNGKTTTKELCHAVLSKKFNLVATPGNLNNHIGVPLTVLSIAEHTEMAVVEMGANHPGEISTLCRIARPELGIITNIGRAHLEGFGGFEGVVRAKRELYDFIGENGGTLFVNADNELLMSLSGSIRRVTYGISHPAAITGRCISADPFLTVELSDSALEETCQIRTHLTGRYNLENILAAFTAGRLFNVDTARIIQAIEQYHPGNMRSQLIDTPHNRVILDAYNANPSSMEAALTNFASLPGPEKWVVLGDMLELGPESLSEHHHIIDLILRLNLQKGILIGEHFASVSVPPGFRVFNSHSEARSYLEKHPVRNRLVLLKGSRAMGLETLIGLF